MTSAVPLAIASAACAAAAVAFRIDPVVLHRLGRPVTVAGRPRPRRVLATLGSVAERLRFRPGTALVGRASLAGWRMSHRELAGAKLACAAFGLVLGLLGPIPILAPVLGVAGHRLPDLAAARAARRRRRLADAQVPVLLDLLAAASTAGLAAPLAIRRSLPALEGPLAEELEAATAATDLGARWRDELRALADRLALPDLARAVTAITRSETLGSSLAEALRELADDVRERRRAAVAERARTAPVKMLFPLVFMILPAFLLLTVVPVLLGTLKTIR